jgi:uncharacterized protein (TIGR02599 family)
MKTAPIPVRSRGAGFTVVELIVSTALIAALMLMLLGTVDQTQRLFQRSTGKIAQFQSARAAYESMTRRLSQATLNTYWRMHDTDVKDSKAEFLYRRHSELQFLSGPTARILTPSPKIIGLAQPVEDLYPTHSVFFQAPLGYSVEPETRGGADPAAQERKFRALDGLLSACGYFIEFGDDMQRPDFLNDLTPPFPPRYRYRLMEMTVPAERLILYRRPNDQKGFFDPRVYNENNTYYAGLVDKDRKPVGNFLRPAWLGKEAALQRELANDGANYRFKFAHPIAENIVALIILPKLAESDRLPPGGTNADPNRLDLAPNYQYDSWRIIKGDASVVSNTVTVLPPEAGKPAVTVSVKLDNSVRDNLLPPIVQVTMVAIDEASAVRLSLTPEKLPTWLKSPTVLFQKVVTEQEFQTDLKELQDRIAADRTAGVVNFRIFSTDVVIRSSKWSRDPQAP